MRIGLDVGSTTIKCVVLDDNDKIVYKTYERHFSQITNKTIELLTMLKKDIIKDDKCSLMIAGSAGMGMADVNKLPFTQEVYATKKASDVLTPNTDVIIELGGEDAKILFLKGNLEVRMNGSCAGGTGAFIDQMSTLLQVTPAELNEMSKVAEKSYTIASRCGVFAKSDVQPLLNQGARKEDIAKSIFYAVANQTVAGLAQGRVIEGNVLYLGGPLTFLPELRQCFDDTLKLKGYCPENSLYFVSLGSAFLANETVDLDAVITSLKNHSHSGTFNFAEPLFKDKADYEEFKTRHDKDKVNILDIKDYSGKAYLGIDAGSTTLKCVLINENSEIIDQTYQSNSGNPVPIIKQYLIDLYTKHPNIQICGSATTGYGEDMIINAFNVDEGIVETFAHLKAAQAFKPDVDFIIDIGGQDMKCFKIKNGTVDNIFLNEACSSGCGSFLQTFSEALNTDIKDFAKLGLFADKPVELGSRCTVFMNSSVKQAQKDGASIENISAGLSMSVVKNAIYKVIRPTSNDDLGHHIVVQGGTFYNDAVLRSFEKELNVEVVRPNIAGLMGAYGCALYAKQLNLEKSKLLNLEQLKEFKHSVSQVNCGLCQNRCQLTVNIFDNNRKYISGNRCQKPVTKKTEKNELNMFEEKRKMLAEIKGIKGKRGKIGIPLGLNMYELLPFWHALFTDLGFEVVNSGFSDRKLYINGQSSIPSDTVCFPAKLLHGHIEKLIDMGVDTIFYPCMSYNIDEHLGDNNYNCPVVAYYPEVIGANMPNVKKITFIKDYVGLHRKKDFPKKFYEIITKYFSDITYKELKHAIDSAYASYDQFMQRIYHKTDEFIKIAKEEKMPIIVLAGRPYHIDPEVSHGIDQLFTGFNACVVTEDAISHKVLDKPSVKVLNQWTYHSRLYASCRYVADSDENMEFVQLVSFGCGCDAITTDECRSILEDKGKIYTQLKIDEITNLGAVKIRLRSLFQASKEMNKQ